MLTATNTSNVLVTDFRDQSQAHSSGLCRALENSSAISYGEGYRPISGQELVGDVSRMVYRVQDRLKDLTNFIRSVCGKYVVGTTLGAFRRQQLPRAF